MASTRIRGSIPQKPGWRQFVQGKEEIISVKESKEVTLKTETLRVISCLRHSQNGEFPPHLKKHL
jgi:hypothetical protein